MSVSHFSGHVTVKTQARNKFYISDNNSSIIPQDSQKCQKVSDLNNKPLPLATQHSSDRPTNDGTSKCRYTYLKATIIFVCD